MLFSISGLQQYAGHQQFQGFGIDLFHHA